MTSIYFLLTCSTMTILNSAAALPSGMNKQHISNSFLQNKLPVENKHSPAFHPTFVLFIKDVSIQISSDNFIQLNYLYRVSARLEDHPSLTDDDQIGTLPNLDYGGEIRGVVRESSIGTKFVSFPCASIKHAGFYKVVVDLSQNNIHKTIPLTSFQMIWPGVTLVLEKEMYSEDEAVIINFIEPYSRSITCPIPVSGFQLVVYYEGQNICEGESQIATRKVYEKAIVRSFNVQKFDQFIKSCTFTWSGLYSAHLFSRHPPALLNSTRFYISRVKSAVLKADVISECIDHVTIYVVIKPKCTRGGDKIRMYKRFKSSRKKMATLWNQYEEVYVSEQSILNGTAQFSCELFEDETVDQFCWRYVSIATDSSIFEHHQHCVSWNQNLTSGFSTTDVDSSWSEWSECDHGKNVKVRRRSCPCGDSNCNPVEFMTCEEMNEVKLDDTADSEDPAEEEEASMPEVGIKSKCGETLARQSGEVVGSCNCMNNSWWVIKTNRHHPVLNITFTHFSPTLSVTNSLIRVRDGPSVSTSDIIFEIIFNKSFKKSDIWNIPITTEAGIVLIELRTTSCDDAVSFIASYTTLKKRMKFLTQSATSEESDKWEGGDGMAMTTMMSAIILSASVLCVSIRRNYKT